MNTDKPSEADARAAYDRLAPIVEWDGQQVDPRDKERTIRLLQGEITTDELIAEILGEKNIGR
ncbi:antitoxin VbhA family protein [Rhodococcus triatomae]